MTTAASDYPGYMVRSTNFKATGKNTEQIMMNVVYVDSNYLKTLDLHLKSGTSFLEAHTPNAIIINESAVRKFGFQNPIGQDLITSWGVKSKIVGVIKDFNFESLHNKVCPLILAEIPGQFNFLICRINDRDISSTLKFISEKWQKIYPGIPFDYSFLDAELGRLYIKDERLSDAVNIFTGLAMVIACLGLFGLASFSVEERTKEIGIRKVLGASVVSVVGLLSKEFLKLVLLANLIAWPLAYYFMTGWLNNFAYRTDITGWVFLTAGGIALFVALATISAHSIKAATANPVKSLKYE
jgi:putative ABC transport system permease protein